MLRLMVAVDTDHGMTEVEPALAEPMQIRCADAITTRRR